MSGYCVAPVFLIRAAGFPFEHLDRLSTTRTAVAARSLLVARHEFSDAKAAVELLLGSRGHGGLSEELFRAWRKAIRSGTMPPAIDQPSRAFAVCWECAKNQADAESALKELLHSELSLARISLLDSSRTLLPAYLVFAAEGVRGLLARQLSEYAADLSALPPRNNLTRKVEHSLILYLQRIVAKNDTFSQFGPSAWGRTGDRVRGLQFIPNTGVARRELFLERWTAHAVAEVMNADPEISSELMPRLNPEGRVEERNFLFTESGETQPLTANDLEVLRRCDGKTPAHLIADQESLRALLDKKIIRCAVEVPALEPYAFDVLVADVEEWRRSPVREKWLSILRPISDLPAKFGVAAGTVEREQVMEEARGRLAAAGAIAKAGERSLYSAINVIGEECVRECDFVINEELLNEAASQAAPWIDLWRDSYAFVASRVAVGLRAVFERHGSGADGIPLPAFLRFCSTDRLPLMGPGLVGLAALAFQEVKNAFVERLREYPETEEHELSAHDCHVVRQNFEYPKFDEYTYPSADLQIDAASAEAIVAGRYRWILSELHPPIALLHHGFYWSCPDVPSLSRALASTTGGRPNFHFGFAAADFTAHTTVRNFDVLPGSSTFISPQRGHPRFQTVPPSEAEVYIEEANGDVCVRQRGTREHLGSFARAWLIPLGFHPFHFGRAPHMPRLRCGKVIVQRRSWTVTLGDLPAGKYSGVSRGLVLALEQLRAAKGLPRHVYIRPTLQALRRSGAEGRDKDTKPVYIDLESYLSLEIFYRWLAKTTELEVTEMLPDPDHLCWQEVDGRRTFELRTLIVPS
ncbi:MAG: lantibiotic dehydratase family protein [Verrucomicrobiota bacterium]|nr:lantibiotic dehydratase family protein [Verrucomicrobiota bacterium]